MHVNSPPLELLNPVVKSAINIPAIIRCHALGHAGNNNIEGKLYAISATLGESERPNHRECFLGGWTIVLIFTIAIVMIARYPYKAMRI
jgi:hypothetical protein